MQGNLALHSSKAIQAINHPMDSIEAFIAFRIRELIGPGHRWSAAKIAAAMGIEPNAVRAIVIQPDRAKVPPEV